MNGHHGSSGSPGAAQPPSSSFFGEPSQQALPPSGLGSVEGQEHQGPNGHLEVYDLKGNKGPSRLRKDTGACWDHHTCLLGPSASDLLSVLQDMYTCVLGIAFDCGTKSAAANTMLASVLRDQVWNRPACTVYNCTHPRSVSPEPPLG